MANGDDGSEDANATALSRITAAEPFLTDLRPAGEVIPELGARELLHAGPPLAGWSEACGALRGSIVGALVHLKHAMHPAEAEEMAAAGMYQLRPANDHNALATFGGVIARDTPVFVVEDRAGARRAFAAINEGRGKALRYGSNDLDTLGRLAWLEGEFALILGAAIRASGGIDIFRLLGQALHMGDDGHSRQKAASALFVNEISIHLAELADVPNREKARTLRFLASNDIFFLPLTMAAAKTAIAAAEGVARSSLTTCMAANGVRFGIKVSGSGVTWHTAPAPVITGQYFDGFGPSDAGPVIGDSEIAETMGLGAFAMAAAPALARYVGGTPQDAMRLSEEMYRITVAEHPRFTIPATSYRGTPFGIDARKVIETGLEPLFNTGIAHRDAGIGQIGAGFGRAPKACFEAALEVLGEAEGL
jgi:hypothetical protein